MLYDDRADVLATLVMLGLLLATVLHFPAWSHELTVLGSALTIRISQTAMMAALLVGITCTGTDAIVRLHPLVRRIDRDAPADRVYSFVTWTVPALTTLLATVLLPQAPSLGYFIASLLPQTRLGSNIASLLLKTPSVTYYTASLMLIGIVLILIVSAEYATVDPADRRYRPARLLLDAWSYLLALVAFVLIYRIKARSLISATEVTLISTLLSLEFLRGARQGFGRTTLYALIAGLSTGEIIWAMNYWRINEVTGGLLLLLGFYIATGVANQQLQGKLTRRVLIEYAAVGLIGLFALLWLRPRL